MAQRPGCCIDLDLGFGPGSEDPVNLSHPHRLWALVVLMSACTPAWVAERTLSIDALMAPEPALTPEPAPSLTTALTVREAIADVLARNPDLHAMRAAVRAMAAMAREELGAPDPMLEVGLSPLAIHTGRGQMIGYRQPIPWTSGLEARARAALQAAEAMAHDREAMRRMLASMTGEAVVEYGAAVAMQRVLVRHHDLMQLMARAAVGRVSAGKGSPREAVRAETEKARADRDRLLAQRMARVALARLATLAHRRPPTQHATATSTVDVDSILDARPTELLPLDGLITAAHRARPELRAAEARIASRKTEVEAAEVMTRPMMTVGVQLNTMPDDPMMWPSVTFSIELPFARDRRRAMVEGARLRVEEATANAATARDRVSQEVAERHAELVEVRAALDVVDRRLLPSAKKSLELAAAAYRGGGGMGEATMGIDPVVLAAEAVLDAEMSRIDLRRRLVVGALLLDLAAGRMPGGGTP